MCGICFNDLCLPTENRDFTSEDSLQLFQKLKYIVEDFSGDAEKFYSVFYDLLLDNLLPSKFEDETVNINLLLQQNQSMFSQTKILKVYNILLVTLFTRCTQSPSFQRTIKVISQQTLSILKAC